MRPFLTNAFAAHALDALDIRPGLRCLDVGAGSDGAALLAARRGASVLAVNASIRTVRRIAARAGGVRPGSVRAAVMDGSVSLSRRASRLGLPSQGGDRAAVLDRFAGDLECDQGPDRLR